MDFTDDVTRYFQRNRDPKLINDGRKKTAKVTFASSSELKEFLYDLSAFLGVGVSELVHRYVVEGIRNDIILYSCPHPHLEQSICESLKKAIQPR
jgi:hypothetical protein